jgi:peptidoglycan hydrolase-like protein with peptidoglycan-binding domain
MNRALPLGRPKNRLTSDGDSDASHNAVSRGTGLRPEFDAAVRPRRRMWAIAIALAAAAGLALGGWAFGAGPFAKTGHPATAAAAIPAGTATVMRTTITATEQDSGTLGYDGNFTVYSSLTGTITWLPAPGSVIRPGQRLFAVDGQNVMLLSGATPAWRDFALGMGDGPDVKELERSLAALGYDPYHQMPVDDHFDWATEAAVARWQAARGIPTALQDGQIPLGQVVFLPRAIRVANLNAEAGATAAGGAAVFTATSTRPVVNVTLQLAATAVRPGQPVGVTLPDGRQTTGRVLRVQPQVASGQSLSQSPAQGQSQGSGGQQAAQAAENVVVALSRPADVAGLGEASVQVAIATQTQPNALAAPISALLAKPGGGYEVTVLAGRARRNVTVQTGLFDEADGVVAISGPGITAGTEVEVPSS